MKKINFLFIVLIPIMFSCNKDNIDVPDGTPSCIKKMIKNGDLSCFGEIIEYEFNGEKIYNLEEDSSCEIIYSLPSIEVYLNKDCETAFSQADSIYIEFVKNRTNKIVIWEKNIK